MTMSYGSPPPPNLMRLRRNPSVTTSEDYQVGRPGAGEGLALRLRRSRSGTRRSLDDVDGDGDGDGDVDGLVPPVARATGVNHSAASRSSSVQGENMSVMSAGYHQQSELGDYHDKIGTPSVYSSPGTSQYVDVDMDVDRANANANANANPFRVDPGEAEGDDARAGGSPEANRESSGREMFAYSYQRNALDEGRLSPPGRHDPDRDMDMPPGEIHDGSGYDNEHKDARQEMHEPFSALGHSSNRSFGRHDPWYDEVYAGKGGFEKMQARNDEAGETYFVDERLRGRYSQDLPYLGFHESSYPENTQQQRDDRKAYRDRRKKDKHIIRYHPEPMEDCQRFLLILAKALLTFGSPSHRVESQLQSIAKVFELEAQFQHTPGVIQISFGNPENNTSETCLIKANVALSLERIHAIHNIYRAVLHDDMYATDGTRQLRKLLVAPPQYGQGIRFVLSFITCFLICGIAFGGSLNDMWVAGVMGLLVRIMAIMASKSDLSASGSEVFSAALVSFIARAFASYRTQIWCFSAISSSGVISLLPGYLILSGTLDIAGKNQSLGAPKIVSGIMTSLYLGFGLTLGSDAFLFVDRAARRAARAAAARLANNVMLQGSFQAYNSTDSGFAGTGNATVTGFFTFLNSNASPPSNIVSGCFRDPNWGWYLHPVPYWSLFFLVPLFAICSSMNNQQPWWSRQMIVMVTIACLSFWITRLCNITLGLTSHPDYVSLIGSWLVGILGNGYSRRFGGTAFTAMLTGILLLVPDGLAAGGGLAQRDQGMGQDEYTQSLTLARKMISVIIGVLAGVYSSAAIIYMFGKKKNTALVTF